MRPTKLASPWLSALIAPIVALVVVSLSAQDRLRTMPGVDQYQKMQPQIAGSWVTGAISVTWEAGANAFTYTRSGKAYRFDLATMKAVETGDAPASGSGAGSLGARGTQGGGRGQGAPPEGQAQGQAPPAGRAGRGGGSGGAEQAQAQMPAVPMPGCPNLPVARGRQAICVLSPDGTHKAFYRDRNLWIANADGSGETQVTTDGSGSARIKYGVASWVYGEELSQTTAMWWSPDSTKLGFYRFDESHVTDFYLQTNQTQVQDTLDVEAYPKPGAPNPIADVLVYDVASRKTTPIDARDGRPFDNSVVGHYVYNIHWLPDSS